MPSLGPSSALAVSTSLSTMPASPCPRAMSPKSRVEIYDKIFDINVRGVLLSMKHQIPAMLKTGGGAIVNNASALGIRPVGTPSTVYHASKFAVIGLTKSTAMHFATKGVRVNVVCPAIIETELTEGLRGNEELSARLRAAHPMGRFGKSEEVAAAVLYLCSPGTAYSTGAVLPVDGGFAV